MDRDEFTRSEVLRTYREYKEWIEISVIADTGCSPAVVHARNQAKEKFDEALQRLRNYYGMHVEPGTLTLNDESTD